MTPLSILICFLAYTLLIFFIAYLTTRKSDNDSFFIGNKASYWYVVSYGMIGASLSGVTFISIPGWVGESRFSYMSMATGYLLGYAVIALVLMPLYYKLNLTSIYTYLEKRFGFWSYKTGAFFFLISRIIGASFRMFLVINVLQIFVFDTYDIPFGVTVSLFIGLILLYTYRGGIKTIVWTDTLQTTFMLLAVVITIFLIVKDMGMGLGEISKTIFDSEISQVLFFDWSDKRFFLKQFFSGAFISIVMTGLDQDMMQKNLSCRNIGEAKKNMFSFSIVLFFVNFLFLFLGAILYLYVDYKGIIMPEHTDTLFPLIALKHLGAFAGVVFVIGLISAAYSSADSALTSLTTSFCVDFLKFKEKDKIVWGNKKMVRNIVHVGFSVLLLLVIIAYRSINDKAIIDKLFTVAGYTYGPLLGLYAYGMFTKIELKDKFVPVICVLSPLICYVLNANSENWLLGYKFGFELLIYNGIITFVGLYLLRNKKMLE